MIASDAASNVKGKTSFAAGFDKHMKKRDGWGKDRAVRPAPGLYSEGGS